MLLAAQIAFGVGAFSVFAYIWRTHDESNRHSVARALLFAGGFVALISLWTLPLIALTAVGVPSEAKVVAIECPKGQKHYVRFEYSVDNRTFSSKTSTADFPGACESLKPGTIGSVIYLPGAPHTSVWQSPWPRLQFNLLLSGFVLVASFAIALWRKEKAL
jgi:hypothetical protein